MFRTYPICQTPSHRHHESLRGMLRRIERELEHEPRRQTSIRVPARRGAF